MIAFLIKKKQYIYIITFDYQYVTYYYRTIFMMLFLIEIYTIFALWIKKKRHRYYSVKDIRSVR